MSLAVLKSRALAGMHAPEVTVEEIDFVEQRLGLAPRSRILDVPCGSGRHSLELARRGHSVTGVDLSAEAIGHARQAAADLDVELVHADMREIPRDNEFDARGVPRQQLRLPRTRRSA